MGCMDSSAAKPVGGGGINSAYGNNFAASYTNALERAGECGASNDGMNAVENGILYGMNEAMN